MSFSPDVVCLSSDEDEVAPQPPVIEEAMELAKQAIRTHMEANKRTGEEEDDDDIQVEFANVTKAPRTIIHSIAFPLTDQMKEKMIAQGTDKLSLDPKDLETICPGGSILGASISLNGSTMSSSNVASNGVLLPSGQQPRKSKEAKSTSATENKKRRRTFASASTSRGSPARKKRSLPTGHSEPLATDEENDEVIIDDDDSPVSPPVQHDQTQSQGGLRVKPPSELLAPSLVKNKKNVGKPLQVVGLSKKDEAGNGHILAPSPSNVYEFEAAEVDDDKKVSPPSYGAYQESVRKSLSSERLSLPSASGLKKGVSDAAQNSKANLTSSSAGKIKHTPKKYKSVKVDKISKELFPNDAKKDEKNLKKCQVVPIEFGNASELMVKIAETEVHANPEAVTAFYREGMNLKVSGEVVLVPVEVFERTYRGFKVNLSHLLSLVASAELDSHFEFDHWAVTHVSAHVAKHIIASHDKSPDCLYRYFSHLASSGYNPSLCLKDFLAGKYHGEEKTNEKTSLWEMDQANFLDAMGMCTKETADRIRAQMLAREAQMTTRSTRRSITAPAVATSPSLSSRESTPPSTSTNQPAKAQLGEGSRNCLVSPGKTTPLFRPSNKPPPSKPSFETKGEPKVEKRGRKKKADTPGAKPSSHHKRDVIAQEGYFTQTNFMIKRGQHLPEGWKIQHAAPGKELSYHYKYISPDGKVFKSYPTARKYADKCGESSSPQASTETTASPVASESSTESGSNGLQSNESSPVAIEVSPTTEKAASVEKPSNGLKSNESSPKILEVSPATEKAASVKKPPGKKPSLRNKIKPFRKFASNANVPRSCNNVAPPETTKADQSQAKKKRQRSAAAIGVPFSLARIPEAATATGGGWFSKKLETLKALSTPRMKMAEDGEGQSKEPTGGVTAEGKVVVGYSDGDVQILDRLEWIAKRAEEEKEKEKKKEAAAVCKETPREVSERISKVCKKNFDMRQETERRIPAGFHKVMAADDEGGFGAVMWVHSATGHVFKSAQQAWAHSGEGSRFLANREAKKMFLL